MSTLSTDHFNASTIKALHKARPIVRFGACSWMVSRLQSAGISHRAIDVFEAGKEYEYHGIAKIQAEILVHDVPNCGYHITFPGGERLFYATDTATLSHVKVVGYDWLFIESNYGSEEIKERIAAKEANGIFAYERRAEHNHLSREQAEDWLVQNAGPNSKYVFLHQHQEKEKST